MRNKENKLVKQIVCQMWYIGIKIDKSREFELKDILCYIFQRGIEMRQSYHFSYILARFACSRSADFEHFALGEGTSDITN